ncbi:MAG: hypothetical protein LBL97_03475 [Prevotellaceae bacterium]|jgi:hypothetical protein|nr:hypothetical protein [Prevotellaceae bacterium]
MKKIFYLLPIGIAMLMTSCASTSRTGTVAPFAQTEMNSIEIRSEVDLSVKNKVEGKASQLYVFGIRVSGGNKFFEDSNTKRSMFGRKANKAQACAIYNALENGEYDMIASPQYRNVVHRWFFGLVKRYDVIVTGFGGKIVGIYQEEKTKPDRTIQIQK